ncbi:hypothetical protein [Prescottella agglutinans]|uniref:hypothetical protein n=1 Tax=Prescottella agglutinans TaxID=1644129 RepID=UPI003D955532
MNTVVNPLSVLNPLVTITELAGVRRRANREDLRSGAKLAEVRWASASVVMSA